MPHQSPHPCTCTEPNAPQAHHPPPHLQLQPQRLVFNPQCRCLVLATQQRLDCPQLLLGLHQ